MNKVITIICCLVFMITAFSGCNKGNNATQSSDNGRYEIKQINNDFCLVIDEETAEKIESSVGMAELGSIMFDSIEEWIDTVKNGKLDDHQLAIANKTFKKDSNGNILVCDFSDIKVPVHPKGFKCKAVGWGGRHYSYILGNADGVEAYAHYLLKEGYEFRYGKDYLNFFDQDLISLKKVIEGKDATEYYYSTAAGELKSVRYVLANGDTTLYIEETYRLEMKDSSLAVSSEIPSSIYIYGSGSNGYFIITIYGLKNRPNVEWLKQFGLEKYKQ